jgi:probable addiction module antidote protein
MKTLEEATIPWDPARYLENEEAQLAYLALVLEEDEPAEFQEAFGIVARARGMTEVARSADLARDTL